MKVYYNYLDAMLPRWGGSHKALLSFGKECLATGRFDTPVPKIFYEAVLKVSERDRETSVWTTRGLDRSEDLLRGQHRLCPEGPAQAPERTADALRAAGL